MAENRTVGKERKGSLLVVPDLGTNKNGNTMIHNLWDIAKSLLILKRKFIGIKDYLGKQEKSQINDLTLHLK